jgi:tRNA 2-thiouridine synthesizing protein A
VKEISLDARGLACPLPVLKARKHLLGAPGPVRVSVRVSDPASEKEFRLFCEDLPCRFVGAVPAAADDIVITIEKE